MAARAQSENLSREVNRLNAESVQLKPDLAVAQTEIEASNRDLREVTGARHAAEIEVTRTRTALQAKEEALQVEITRRTAIDNSVTELRAQLKGLIETVRYAGATDAKRGQSAMTHFISNDTLHLKNRQ